MSICHKYNTTCNAQYVYLFMVHIVRKKLKLTTSVKEHVVYNLKELKNTSPN